MVFSIRIGSKIVQAAIQIKEWVASKQKSKQVDLRFSLIEIFQGNCKIKGLIFGTYIEPLYNSVRYS
jgi:hypothetical protein